jgi:hypothetical protein
MRIVTTNGKEIFIENENSGKAIVDLWSMMQSE